MRDDGAGNTSDVTSEEGNSGLLEPVIGRFGFAQVLVNFVDGGFEGCEFTHCIGNLTSPEGVESFIEAGGMLAFASDPDFIDRRVVLTLQYPH